MGAVKFTRCRRVQFTLNNPTAEEKAALLAVTPDNSRLVYFIAYNECVATPHLQGYFEVTGNLLGIGECKAIPGLKRAHFETAKGSGEQNVVYCTKDGNKFHQFGKLGKERQSQGSRTGGQNEQLKFDTWAQLITGCDTWEDILDCDGLSIPLAKYEGWVTAKFNRFSKTKVVPMPTQLRKFQHDILKLIEGPVDDRKVYVFVGQVGNEGKTYLSKVLKCHFGAVGIGNKTADAAYAWNGEKIVIFDLSRTVQERINWDLIEQVKNGVIFSGKFRSMEKIHRCPHVLIFTNQAPDQSKLSHDRWEIKYLYEEDLVMTDYVRVVKAKETPKADAVILVDESDEEEPVACAPRTTSEVFLVSDEEEDTGSQDTVKEYQMEYDTDLWWETTEKGKERE